MYHNEKLRRDKGRERNSEISSVTKKTREFQRFPSVVIDCIHKMLSNYNFNLKENVGPVVGKITCSS